jgi:hypothetical protein
MLEKPKHFVEASEVSKFINRKLYKFNTAQFLAYAWNSRENIIMYGPGGYGKSQAAVMFHDFLKEKGKVEKESKPYIMSFGQGMTEERLLGGLDVKKFQDEGEIVYHLKHAFVSHEMVIFEEIWDAFPAVLLILKDILQSGEVRMGNQRMKIKTKLVVACTNRSREEVVTDDSTEALLQRFPFEVEVKWSSHKHADYAMALEKALSDQKDVNELMIQSVSAICADIADSVKKSDDRPVSPRTCYKAYKVAVLNGLEALKGFYGFSAAVNREIPAVKTREIMVKQKHLISKMASLADTIEAQIQNNNSIIPLGISIKIFTEMKKIISGIRSYEVNVTYIKDLQERLSKMSSQSFSRIKEILKPQNPPKGSVAEKMKIGNMAKILEIIKIPDDEPIWKKIEEFRKEAEEYS